MAFIVGDSNNIPNGYTINTSCHAANTLAVVYDHLRAANLFQTSGNVTIGANNTNFGNPGSGSKELVVIIRDSNNSITIYNADESSNITISIPSGRVVSNVIFASYGTPTVITTPAVKMDDTGWYISTTSRPASAANGQIIYNATEGKMEIYYNGVWKDIVDIRQGDYFYKTVITTSYVLGGYKNSSPWKNVNRMVHSTDVCTNLGDQLSISANYVSGACNLTKAFVFNASNSHPGTTNTTVAFNMTTETNAGLNGQWDTVGAKDDPATIFQQHYYAYILGAGSSDVDVFNLTTETAYKQGAGLLAEFGDTVGVYNTTFTSTTGAGSISDERWGYAWGGTGQANATKLTFSTHTLSTANASYGSAFYQSIEDYPGYYYLSQSPVSGAHGQQKGINSKLGKGWAGNEGSYNGGYNLRRWDFSTETNLGTVSKPIGNSGEENFDMGQDHQYMMGMYDGAQNNRGWKFTYSTESGYELGSGSIRTGVAGGSSGHCAWKG